MPHPVRPLLQTRLLKALPKWHPRDLEILMWFQRRLTVIGRHLAQVWYPDAKDSRSRKGTSATVVSRQRVPGNRHVEVSTLDREEHGWRICGSPIHYIRDVYYLG
jgi:hypothetical protein